MTCKRCKGKGTCKPTPEEATEIFIKLGEKEGPRIAENWFAYNSDKIVCPKCNGEDKISSFSEALTAYKKFKDLDSFLLADDFCDSASQARSLFKASEQIDSDHASRALSSWSSECEGDLDALWGIRKIEMDDTSNYNPWNSNTLDLLIHAAKKSGNLEWLYRKTQELGHNNSGDIFEKILEECDDLGSAEYAYKLAYKYDDVSDKFSAKIRVEEFGGSIDED